MTLDVFEKTLHSSAARWIVTLEQCQQRFMGGPFLFIIEGYPEAYWTITEPFELSFGVIDVVSGIKTNLCPLRVTGSLDVGCGKVQGEDLIVNGGHSLLRFEKGSQTWSVIAERRDALLVGDPRLIDRWVVCAWEKSDSKVLLSRSGSDGTRWSPPLVGSVVREVLAEKDWIYILANSPEEEGHQTSQLHQVAFDELSRVKTEQIPFAASILKRGEGVLYVAGTQSFRVLPPGPFITAEHSWSVDDLLDSRSEMSYTVQGETVVGKQDTGNRSVGTLHCLTHPDRSTLTVQLVAGGETCENIIVLRDGQVFITSRSGFGTTVIERLGGPTEALAPVVLASGWPNAAPVELVGNRAIWMIEDYSRETLLRAMAGAAEKITRFRLLLLESTSDLVNSHYLDWGENFEEVLAASDAIILAGESAAAGIAIDALYSGNLTKSAPRRARPIKKAPVGGPRIDLWGYDHEDDFLRKLLSSIVSDAEGFWSMKEEERQTVLGNLKSYWIRNINETLPDPIALERRFCPSRLIDMLHAGDSKFSTEDAQVQFRQWSDDIRRAAALPEVFVEAGRFLLFEFIRENKHLVNLQTHILCEVESPFFREMLSWLNLGELNYLRDAVKDRERHGAQRFLVPLLLTLGGLVTVALILPGIIGIGTAIAGALLASFYSGWRVRKLRKRAQRLAHFDALSSTWSLGAPSMLGEWHTYRRMVEEIDAIGYLSSTGRSPLQNALWKVWNHLGNPLKKDVFLSYSHYDANIAARLATELRLRGVSVAFDNWQPGLECDDREVELWIAENVLSATVNVYLVSESALGSGWIRREADWERRLLGLRPTVLDPCFVLLDASLKQKDYPTGRVFDGDTLTTANQVQALAEALAEQVLSERLNRIMQTTSRNS